MTVILDSRFRGNDKRRGGNDKECGNGVWGKVSAFVPGQLRVFISEPIVDFSKKFYGKRDHLTGFLLGYCTGNLISSNVSFFPKTIQLSN